MSSAITRKVFRRKAIDPEAPKAGYRLVLEQDTVGLNEPTDVLIEVKAVSLNYRDANMLNGTNPWPVAANGIPCSDAAGVVVAVGAKVTSFTIGDRVSPIMDQHAIYGHEQIRAWLGGEIDGVLATHCVFPEGKLVKIPAHLSWAEAACLPCAGLTAWNVLTGNDSNGLLIGKTVLIQGTGGVSLMALKLAQAAGSKVILTSSSDAKLEKVRSAQRTANNSTLHTINYSRTPDWDQEALRLNGGRGVDVVVENGGTKTLLKSIRATAKRGRISQVGYLGHQDVADLEGVLSALIERAVVLQ